MSASAGGEIFVRLLCKVTARPDRSWGDIGFAYFEALFAAGIPTRVFSNGPGDLASGRWAPHGEDFLRTVPRSGYINVVCGTLRDASLSMTSGVRNVIVTDVAGRTPARNEALVLSLAELVVVPDAQQVERLAAHGVTAHVVPPAEFAGQILALRGTPRKF